MVIKKVAKLAANAGNKMVYVAITPSPIFAKPNITRPIPPTNAINAAVPNATALVPALPACSISL